MAITLEQIEVAHTRVAEMIEQFKKQPTAHVISAAVIPLQPGERYAGAALNADGTVAYHLIRMAGHGGALAHADALAYATGRGGKLPNKQEGRLLQASMPEEMAEASIWLEEEYESNASCAWSQGCRDGGHFNHHKSAALRAVAVRRFIPSVL